MEVLITMKEENKQLIKERITRILVERGEILFAYIFGSFVHDPGFHDLDVGVYLREDAFMAISTKGTFDYEMTLGVALEKELGYPVDVKVLNHAPAALGHAVTDGRVLLSRDEARRLDWVETTWSRYLDMLPFFRASLFDLLDTK